MKKFPINDQSRIALERKVQLSATGKFKQGFSLPHHNHADKKLIDCCCEHFAKILHIDLLIKMLGLLELKKCEWDPEYFTASFIAVFDGIYNDLKDGR